MTAFFWIGMYIYDFIYVYCVFHKLLYVKPTFDIKLERKKYNKLVMSALFCCIMLCFVWFYVLQFILDFFSKKRSLLYKWFSSFTVTPMRKKWCWNPQHVEVQIKDTHVKDIKLHHSGYYLKCLISHNITLVGVPFCFYQTYETLLGLCRKEILRRVATARHVDN